MAYDEKLANRIREMLHDIPKVTEKKMFGGLAFMVNNKMCITTSNDRIMCRIDPALHEEMVTKTGCSTVMMKGRAYKGFVHVDAESIKSKKDLEYWMQMALDYNQRAEASRKK